MVKDISVIKAEQVAAVIPGFSCRSFRMKSVAAPTVEELNDELTTIETDGEWKRINTMVPVDWDDGSKWMQSVQYVGGRGFIPTPLGTKVT